MPIGRTIPVAAAIQAFHASPNVQLNLRFEARPGFWVPCVILQERKSIRDLIFELGDSAWGFGSWEGDKPYVAADPKLGVGINLPVVGISIVLQEKMQVIIEGLSPKAVDALEAAAEAERGAAAPGGPAGPML